MPAPRCGAPVHQDTPSLATVLRRFLPAFLARGPASPHILPAGFTKIRHYGILGNNRRATCVPQARQALERSPWRLDSSPVPRTVPPKREARRCPRCGSDELECVGRLDASGRFLGLRRGAALARLRAGEPPGIQDSS